MRHSLPVTADRGVGSWIERRARVAADEPALIHGGARRTYGQLASRVRRLAHGLRDLGVGRGDRVGWLGPNHPAFLEVLFAAARIGAVAAPVNHRLDPAVIGDVLREFSPTVAVVEPSAAGIPLPAGIGARVVVANASDPDVDYEDLLARSADAAVDEVTSPDDLCMLPHTSGTTGKPKGVMLTHGNVTWNVFNLLSVVDFRGDDVTIAIAPFFRTGGTGVNVLPVLFTGGTVVVPETGDPDHVLQLIEEHRVTIGFGNPDLLEALTRSPQWRGADLSSIRFFITGGAPVPERLIRTCLERGVTCLQGYGLSEAAPFVLLLDAPSALDKIGSAGKPALFVDVRTVRPDGTDSARDETGELIVRGPNVMSGYWRRPDATRAALHDGWLRTGDAARIDGEGYVWIVDRVADAYEVSGRVVYPGDVERALAAHPAVADAAVAAHGGTATAFVVVAAGSTVNADELIDCCRARLAAHAVPSSVELVDGLPRNSVGKLLRHELPVR
jgi:fatty-acyl-CoA synthase